MCNGRTMPGQRTVCSGNSGMSISSATSLARSSARGVGAKRSERCAGVTDRGGTDRRGGGNEGEQKRRSRRAPGGFSSGGSGAARARLSSVGAALRGATVVGGPEARAAAAGRDSVRVVHGETGAHQGVDVVDLRALQEVDALAIDVDLDAVDLKALVLGRRGILQHHPVAVAGATAGIDVDA